MALEIERKFLVNNPKLINHIENNNFDYDTITQGYITVQVVYNTSITVTGNTTTAMLHLTVPSNLHNTYLDFNVGIDISSAVQIQSINIDTFRIRTVVSGNAANLDRLGYLTLKGKNPALAFGKHEFEFKIPYELAVALLDNVCSSTISKERHYVVEGNLRFEVDCFYAPLDGMIVAEIELPSEETQFTKPEWLGREVTHLKAYKNKQLAKALRIPEDYKKGERYGKKRKADN